MTRGRGSFTSYVRYLDVLEPDPSSYGSMPVSARASEHISQVCYKQSLSMIPDKELWAQWMDVSRIRSFTLFRHRLSQCRVYHVLT